MIASLTFFDPELAGRALLVFSTFNEFLEHLIGQIRVLGALELLAGQALVEIVPARKTVPFLASRAVEIVAIFSLLIHEGILAIRSGTPGHVALLGECLTE